MLQIIREVFGHAFGQRGNQHALTDAFATPDFRQQVIDLSGDAADLYGRVDQPCGSDDLLHHLAAAQRKFHFTWRSGREYHLADDAEELVSVQGPVVEGGGQAESIFDEGEFSGPVSLVHAADLRECDVRFVDEGEKFCWKVIEQAGRTLTRQTSREVATVVLNAGAHARLEEHIDVEHRAGIETLGFQQLAGRSQLREPFLEFFPNRAHGPLDGRPPYDEVGCGVHGTAIQLSDYSAGERVDLGDPLDRVPPQLDANRLLLVRREDFNGVTPHAKRAPLQYGVVPRVSDANQLLENRIPGSLVTDVDRDHEVAILDGIAQSVDRAHGGDDDDVTPLHQARGSSQAQRVDVFVDARVLFYVRIGRRDVRLRLVVVVIGDEVLDGVRREEPLEFAVQLGRQGLVVRDDQRRATVCGDGACHRNRLSRAGDTQQCVEPFVARRQALGQFGDGARLVAGQREGQLEFERHAVSWTRSAPAAPGALRM